MLDTMLRTWSSLFYIINPTTHPHLTEKSKLNISKQQAEAARIATLLLACFLALCDISETGYLQKEKKFLGLLVLGIKEYYGRLNLALVISWWLVAKWWKCAWKRATSQNTKSEVKFGSTLCLSQLALSRFHSPRRVSHLNPSVIWWSSNGPYLLRVSSFLSITTLRSNEPLAATLKPSANHCDHCQGHEWIWSSIWFQSHLLVMWIGTHRLNAINHYF